MVMTRGSSVVAFLPACVFDDMASIRPFNSRVYVRRPVAGAWLPGATLAAKFCAPGPVRVVLADEADAEADRTIRIGHDMKKRAGLAPEIASIPRLGYTANCLRTAAAELPTLSTAFCNASFDTPRAWVQYLTS